MARVDRNRMLVLESTYTGAAVGNAGATRLQPTAARIGDRRRTPADPSDPSAPEHGADAGRPHPSCASTVGAEFGSLVLRGSRRRRRYRRRC
jgi:hypothetical protein